MGMRNAATIVTFLLFSFFFGGLTQDAKPERFDKWSRRLARAGVTQEQVTRLHFYFHDIVSGKHPTAVRVAQAANSDRSPTAFGVVVMADDPLTEGPDPNSRLVGRAQGLYGSAGQEELGLIMAMNYRFTDGKYNGSSFSLNGLNRALDPVREMAIVGGTGVFRLARGVAMAKTYSLNTTTGDAIVEYNVTVVH
ncbi:Dirigent protein 23 [Cocos nucifera]|uniref:Dirigent protein n=1 Tax=Cocos nucifera TaxID=13894 RepID=A0A8K0IKA7_COCNU|nr:Dirigent protein 23 [Cocos nucifera]